MSGRPDSELPLAYRQFVEKFGAGKLFGVFTVAVPQGGEESPFDLADRNSFYLDTQADQIRDHCKDPERALRLHIFGETVSTTFLGWDPEEVTNPTAHEYAVYELDRLFRLKRRASSFREFVEEYCLGPGFLVENDWDEKESGPRRVYMAAYRVD